MRVVLSFIIVWLCNTVAYAHPQFLEPSSVGSIVAHVAELAGHQGLHLTNEQKLFARDMIVGYFRKPVDTRAANIIWLRVPRKMRSQFDPVLNLVIQTLSQQNGGFEHLRLADYMRRTPEAFARRMRSQQKHLIIFDDFAELNQIEFDVSQTEEMSARLNRGHEYDKWVFFQASNAYTLFIIDHDEEILSEMDLEFRRRINYVGHRYWNVQSSETDLDALSTEGSELLTPCEIWFKN